jgi:hypothetical protein
VTEGSTDEDCGCKVGRTSDAYGLEAIDEYLRNGWLGRGGPERSLRGLADEFNERVLSAAITSTGETPLDSRLESYYRALTDDDISAGERTEVRRELERAGVDVESVQSDFVSHQTIHSHLTDCLDVEKPDVPQDPSIHRAEQQEKIQALLNRCSAVAEDSIDRLAGHEALSIGEFELFVELTVLCTDCGQRQSVPELLRTGHCDCTSDARGD